MQLTGMYANPIQNGNFSKLNNWSTLNATMLASNVDTFSKRNYIYDK